MNKSTTCKTLVLTAISLGALCVSAWSAEASEYVQVDLVSDIPGLAALTDHNLQNSWGVSHLPGSPFWVSDQLTNVSTLYAVTGPTNVSVVPLVVSIPPAGGPGPTGQVANGNSSSFTLGDGSSAFFMFANLNGTISAWNGGEGTAAVIAATTTSASYTGLAINQADTMLYAANGIGAGSIDVFNGTFTKVTVPGGFVDPNLPAGYVPFNVQDIGGKVYVTYAPAGHAAQAGATAGMGVVDVYDENGNLLKRLVSGSALAAPWGIALAPASFGQFGGDLLVGNFSYVDSQINAYDSTTGKWEGMIPIDPGMAMGENPGGLWALDFGGGGKDGSPDTLYFTDGINSEADGLFGAIVNVPEPSTWALMLAGFVGLGLAATRKRRSPLTIG